MFLRVQRRSVGPVKFKCILADPPWAYGVWGGNSGTTKMCDSFLPGSRPLPYPSMTVDQIKAMPVRQLAADDCELYLWTTQKYLPHAFGVISAWGFKYCQTLTWCKTPRGTGQGGLYCPTTEFLLLGRRGKMPIRPRLDTTWWNIKRTLVHSRKPEVFRMLVEYMSDGPRLELFSRSSREGWTTWGNEAQTSVKLGSLEILDAHFRKI